MYRILSPLLLVAVCGCTLQSGQTGNTALDAVVTIEERYITAFEPQANIDSVAVAAARPGRPALLFATAKETDVIKVFDASTGQELEELGGSGTSPDRYRRPNGVAVVDDLLIVVERDNRRLNIRSLPDYDVLATFGADVLENPYGLWVQPLGDGEYRAYVTDAYEMPDESIPPNEQLDERVKSFKLSVRRHDDGRPSSVEGRFERAFGETTSPGALRVVESIFGDPTHDRLLIAEEDEDPVTGLVIKAYDLDGRFTGAQVGQGVFEAQAEGIALYACGDGAGYWLSTDQAADRTVYHIFDRRSLEHVGAFMGETTANTDGVWLATSGVPGFARGAFFAVHDDQAVSAFDWAEIVALLDLESCST
ncbi:MAG: phytase [Woeseiaceae bacterium]